MIKMRADKLCLVGLSDGNLEMLRQGKPIVMELTDFGIEGDIKFCILWGPTEAAICAELGLGDDAVAAAQWAEQQAKEREAKRKGSH